MTQGRLLVLDDDPMTGQTIQSIAEFAGMEVRSTTSSSEFFELVESWQPDVIALDLIMPDMDGVQVMAELAKRRTSARLIITSGVGSRVLDAAARSAAEHGLDMAGILSKPFLPAALRDLLAKALDERPASARPAARQRSTGEVTLDELRRALVSHELFVVYQPKLLCQSGALAGFEALVRWQHPERGLVPPDQFIPLAERSGLMNELTREVLSLALEWFAGLRSGTGGTLSRQTRETITLSVNVSAVSLDDVALFDWLEALCDRLDLPKSRLILELTETSAMEDPVASLDIMTRLRMKGFQLSIDDFGTGYSSMLQLVRLPFSEIKVDKSFVMTAGRSEESRSVIRSVVDLGRSLGLKSTAEGVEDESTLSYLRRIGCDLAQGYHIGKPMPSEEVLKWARDHDASRETLRLEALRTLDILDTPEEARFDRLTSLAQRLLGVPMVMVSLVDAERQWFKSAKGVAFREAPREHSFCTHAIQEGSVTVVTDAASDPRFSNSPLVTRSPNIRAYAGCPIQAVGGATVGTLCLADTAPRTFTSEEQNLLQALAKLVEKELLDTSDATLDPLTQLLNRHSFETRARDALELAARLGQPATLLFIDLDQLGRVAERFGSAEADHVLAAFGAIMRETFRDTDLLARLGGDEFVALMQDASLEDAEAAEQRLSTALTEFNRHNRLDYRLSITLGRAGFDGNQPRDLQGLLAEADSQIFYQRQSQP